MFSVRDDNPFVIFRLLQGIAREKRGEDFIDLSRGDPGYGFTPSVRGRIFASTILELDSILNERADRRFLRFTATNLPEINNIITTTILERYAPKVAEERLALLEEFITHVITSAKNEGKNWARFDVLRELFAFSPMSGGSYLLPQGQELTRVIVAAWHRKEYGVPLKSADIILINGVSHGIGTLFKALGAEGCGFLKKDDGVIIGSPVYAPYLSILEERGIKAVTFSLNPKSGALAALPTLQSSQKPKALILIDPNNPTGFSLPEKDLERLAEFAREHDLLVITDEVYSSFFPKKKTMLAVAPERTICLNARSKIERSTGLRFGEIITRPAGRQAIAKKLGLKDAAAFERLLLFAKAPGSAGGQFQHTTFVPGPAQLMGIAHLVLGGKEREQYRNDLRENTRIFAKELGLPYPGNLYYTLFDLNGLPGCSTKKMPIEEKLTKLAEAGVIYIPAHRFFSEETRTEETLTFVRASVVNTTPERLKEAAKRTRKVLC